MCMVPMEASSCTGSTGSDYGRHCPTGSDLQTTLPSRVTLTDCSSCHGCPGCPGPYTAMCEAPRPMLISPYSRLLPSRAKRQRMKCALASSAASGSSSSSGDRGQQQQQQQGKRRRGQSPAAGERVFAVRVNRFDSAAASRGHCRRRQPEVCLDALGTLQRRQRVRA